MAEPILPARSAFQHPDTASPTGWSARWIGTDEPSHPNQWLCFRQAFNVSRVPRRALARIAVDSKYWLWLNGTLVVREGGLKRGPTPTDTYFDEVDLAPHLKRGENTIAILVWYFGRHGFAHKDSGRCGLLVQVDAHEGAKPLLATDATWRVKEHPAFGNTGEPHPNKRLSEANIRFDARDDIPAWIAPNFADGRWPKAAELGLVPCAPWNRLVRRPIPLWRDSEKILRYVEEPALPAGTQSGTVIGKLPHNAQVMPWLKVEAKVGQTIDVRMDNYNGGSELNVRAEYVTRSGVQEFECLGWMNGHEVHYAIPAGVKVLELGYRESGYDSDETGNFSCDDSVIEQLRVKAVRTLYLTMRDTYMDCPDRERAQWWGDVVNELGEVFYSFDARADQLTRKAILELIAWQKPDGVLFSPVPAGSWDRDLPLQMLASIGRCGFWNYALFSGDLATIRAVYAGVKRYIEIWDLQPDGRVIPRPGAWAWGDWGDDVDMTALANIWYHLALQGQRFMAQALGEAGDLPWIESRLATVQQAFNEFFWTGTAYRSPDHKGKTDDRTNALAVVAGLAPRRNYPALREVLHREEHASPYMEKYVLEALCLLDDAEFAQERMKRRYAKMIEHAYTTLWEGWGIGSEGYGGGTINHAWSGGPLTIMSQYFAGVAPTSPAFATYEVMPQPGALKKVSATLRTPRGPLGLRYERRDDGVSLTLKTPGDSLGRVGIPVLPGEKIETVRVNGRVVWAGKTAKSRVKGIIAQGPIGEGPRFLAFAVSPGEWEFAVEVRKSKG